MWDVWELASRRCPTRAAFQPAIIHCYSCLYLRNLIIVQYTKPQYTNHQYTKPSQRIELSYIVTECITCAGQVNKYCWPIQTAYQAAYKTSAIGSVYHRYKRNSFPTIFIFFINIHAASICVGHFYTVSI